MFGWADCCWWVASGGRRQRTPQPEAAVTGAPDHALLPVRPLVKLPGARVRRVVEHHLIYDHTLCGVDVGDGVGAPGVIHARDHQHVLKTAAVAGEQVEEVSGVEWIGAVVDLVDGKRLLDLFEALRGEYFHQHFFILPRAGIQVPEIHQPDRSVDQSYLLQDGDGERPAHGGGVGVAPDEVQFDRGIERLFGCEADVRARRSVQGFALLRGERTKVGRWNGGSGGGRAHVYSRGKRRGRGGCRRGRWERGRRGRHARAEQQRANEQYDGEEFAGHQVQL